jgi:hypothetical protein
MGLGFCQQTIFPATYGICDGFPHVWIREVSSSHRARRRNDEFEQRYGGITLYRRTTSGLAVFLGVYQDDLSFGYHTSPGR